ncbi:hypothetical protein A2899_03705 [Candidatus Amesbacteria bacterium RIFCSPLOWO2_01_FULL_49_25]|uniref:Glycosyltransferase 2-like domain-containing protein n=1 Tax=Candidatus Amesbacteria bacterium RIFCSPHIGHO2_01_FULL_48_32b TaxID=1797253 RepID=A0A1F4YE87_9BACT|nr:MAG: hypothetical protein A2876_05295 [Candidatus Amesbacteria bacterium RIFCSPHIGHO2_01_FULL_48_32b]OGD07859.1 MAG: hypothetical protein A2899_03705 [Candidatus Amesbacteria bacterium RIFCSPLOWO2_01_FULL_49_25]
MSQKFTISIGIPALNEEANIGYLLQDLLKQKVGNSLLLKEITVYSDTSTDQTENIVKRFHKNHSFIKLIVGKARVGKGGGMNSIISTTSSDVLIILDADIQVRDKFFIERIAASIVSGKADLTSVLQKELPPRTFLEKIVFAGMKIKNDIYWSYNQGQNLYTCHGHARAFSKRLYQNLRFPEIPGEDAFSYLYCVYNGYSYKFNSPPQTWYKLPNSYADHDKQSQRFLNSIKQQEKFFPPEFVRQQYHLPVPMSLAIVLKHLINNPIYSSLYLLVLTVSQVKSLFYRNYNFAIWDLVTSSKTIRN